MSAMVPRGVSVRRSHVTFSLETRPMWSMDIALAVPTEPLRVETLYREEADRLWRAVFAYAGDPDVASDAVAEAFAQVIRRGDAVRDPAAWTWRTAFKLAAGAMKVRRTPPPPALTTSYTDAYGDPDLLAALRELPERQRAAVVLHYYADLRVSEIARRLESNE